MNNQQVMRKNIEINQAYSIFFFFAQIQCFKMNKIETEEILFQNKKMEKAICVV